jgi:hypothetical protein
MRSRAARFIRSRRLDDNFRHEAMATLPAFFRNVESPDFFRRVAPWLHVDAARSASPRKDSPAEPPAALEPWPAAGYLELGPILTPANAGSLANAVKALRSNAIHPSFLYVFDEAWDVLYALHLRLSPLLGHDFEALADVWAWHIDPRIDRGGWRIHRGTYEDVRDASGTPGLVNLWIALTDAGERNACMHVVPLDRDPRYPDDMNDLGGLESRGVAISTPAGSALAWNANIAHWGGSCDPSYTVPRISMSFTVRRRSHRDHDFPAVRMPLSFRERLDVIAQQFETYGDKELDPDGNEMRWAEAVNGMRRAARLSSRVPD